MKKLRALALLAFGLFVVGCNEDAEDVELRSLQSSTEMTFVCRDRAGQGRPRSECPDFDTQPPAPPERRIFAAVTQTATNELAVIDTLAAQVNDTDKSLPGYSFLRLPGRPGDIVTTPGGTASFVGLTGVGMTGISSIPSGCLDPPFHDQFGRDVTSFPSCSLPSAPGDMVVLVEPPASDGIHVSCDPASALEVQPDFLYPDDPMTAPRLESVPPGAVESIAVCDGVEVSWGAPRWCAWPEELLPKNPKGVYTCPTDGAAIGPVPLPGVECHRVRDCGANLTTEGGPTGRRKLVVALPDEGRIVVIDAQSMLDAVPGTFPVCPIEASYTLSSDVDPSGQMQNDTQGLHPKGCMISRPPAPPQGSSFVARPAGMAALDGRLYVADQGVPLVHVLDVTSPCNLTELPPLLPMSFDDPTRDVTTSRVAVSPLTPSNKRFVYALDQDDRPTASLMAFDVSPGSTDRTPIVRSGSLRIPGEQPDRIQFESPVGDVTFALRDLPREDPETGVATGGLMCNPDPAAPTSDPATLYRPSGDYTAGARPVLLRGLFGFAMLTSGRVAVIDVDDFDAPCRRPKSTNLSSTPDFRGCANDSFAGELVDESGRPTVTDEVTCNMVEPHRARSAVPGAISSTAGQSAPSLRAFPQFTMIDQSSQKGPETLPKLLAVNFRSADEPEGVNAQVYVGNTLYTSGDSGSAALQTDPNNTEQSTLTLPLAETRNYPAQGETTLVTYEGPITGTFQNGFFDFEGADPVDPAGMVGYLSDTSAVYCDHGVYDVAMMSELGSSELGIDEDAVHESGRKKLDQFAEAHSDYVQITDDFPDPYDPYWVQFGDRECGGRKGCLDTFGSATSQSLDPRREFKIIEAYQDHLKVKPRALEGLNADPPPTAEERDRLLTAAQEAVARIDCCFPGATAYTIRTANQWTVMTDNGIFRHDVIGRKGEDPDGPGPFGSYRCERDCDPRKAFNKSRVFEITSTVDCAERAKQEEEPACTVGQSLPSLDDPCEYDPTDGNGTRGVSLTDDAAACILESLTARFAIYRGLERSVRDMRFRWESVGGFIRQDVALTAHSSAVLPQRIEYVPEIQSLFVTDAASLGLSLAPLDTLRVDDPWPVF